MSICEELVIIDFKTTGLSPQDSRIIVGAAIINQHGVIKRLPHLMNPGDFIPAFIMQLTGVTDEMVADQPRPERY